jgi:hypothetical protein
MSVVRTSLSEISGAILRRQMFQMLGVNMNIYTIVTMNSESDPKGHTYAAAPCCRAAGSALEVLALADLVEKRDPPFRAKNTRVDADFYLGALEEARKSVPISDLPQDASDEFKMFACDAQYEGLQVCARSYVCVCVRMYV